MSEKDLVSITKEYYDSQDADEFYFTVWGGEDIHIGIYREKGEAISQASKRTVERMAEMANPITPDTHILDIGAGYGGSARYLAGRFSCRVTCLNLSKKENDRNRAMNVQAGLQNQIQVDEGNFEALPYEDSTFDLIWSQDALLHSDKKKKVLEEVYRVLRPGGRFIFTDPMQTDHCPDGVLDPILARIHLKEMGSVQRYRSLADDIGFRVDQVTEMPGQLVNHYASVLRELSRQEAALKKSCSQGYIDRMKKGLAHWVTGGKSGYLNWGIMVLGKT